MFFKRDVPVQTDPAQELYESLRAKYTIFCTNPLRTMKQVEAEFDQLIHTPKLTTIDFYASDILMLGTEEVIIRHPMSGRLHRIGEFIIYIIRQRTDRSWYVDFRFQNTTIEIYPSKQNIALGEYYMHPHLNVEPHDDLDVPNSRLCIQNGGYQIHQHIRRGEIHLAAPLLIDVLHTYHHDYPFHKLGNWPRVEPEGENHV